ncbi:MAG: MotA/TolQ/ExbB proton channel family protein [Deltaproteobacteria bacterium]|nr:MotA/TolQ/ExbB proton channel family protein [Deltaproteobacteria bacterium]
MFENLSFVGLLQKGGFTVILLGLLSVISIAIMLERAWAFHKFRKSMREFFTILDRTVKESGSTVAAKLADTHISPLATVYLSGYRKKAMGKAEVNGAMELAGRGELARLDRFLGVLGTIGSTAPFIGLFGTVLGIIRAFSDLAIAQGASPAAVADGIAEALVATATGLFVAIPAVMAYNYFVRSASRCALELETRASEFADPIIRGE